MEENRNTIDTPKWLFWAINIFLCWLLFLICFLIPIILLAILNPSLPQSSVLAIFELLSCLAISIILTFKFRRILWAYLKEKSLKIKYIILVILVLLSLFFFPAPFVYIV